MPPTEQEVQDARRLICEVDGHWTFDIVMDSDQRQEPKVVICTKCGRRWNVGKEITE